MGEVHSISPDLPIPGAANPEIVRQLRELLAQAEAGEIEALAVGAVRSDGCLFTGWECREWFKLAAAIGTLNHRFFADGRNNE